MLDAGYLWQTHILIDVALENLFVLQHSFTNFRFRLLDGRSGRDRGFLFFCATAASHSLTILFINLFDIINAYQNAQPPQLLQQRVKCLLIILMNSEETNKKQCIICDKFQSPQKKMMGLFSDKEHICLECYAEQNQMIVQYKKGRPMLYPDYNLIIENLYLGNEDTAMDQQVIKKENIRAILVCGSFLMTPFEETQMEGEFEKICYRKLDIADFPSQKLVHLFDQTLQWVHEMRKQGKNILIHCAAGVSRSSSFTIAYLMKYEQLTFQKAYQLVKQKRKIIRPNSGFINQLKQYEKMLQSKQ